MALAAGAGSAAAQARSSAGSADHGRPVSGGAWGNAEEVPGTAALNTGGNAAVQAVSCPSKGNCSAGGYYTNAGGSPPAQVFVVSEVHGTWGKAIEVPGSAALNTGGSAQIDSVSCASAGKAREVPGTAALNTGGNAAVQSVSCASAGNCSAGGWYTASGPSVPQEAFVVTQTGGSWGKAKEVPGTAALNQTGFAVVNSVSCTSPGNCNAGGEYNDSSDRGQAFVVTQANGTWGAAKEVPGIAALNTGGGSGVTGAYATSVSCASAGNCSAGGQYKDSSGHVQQFVVTKVKGIWDKAIEVPGTAALNQGGSNGNPFSRPSCSSAGNCSAGGTYTDSSGHGQVFVVSQADGTWGTAEQVPGTAALNSGGFAEIMSVSCAPAGTCSAGGFYQGPGGLQAFVVNKT